MTAVAGALLLPLARSLAPALAVGTLVVSLVGLVALFLGTGLAADSLSSEAITVSRVSHGLAALASVMVMVEKR